MTDDNLFRIPTGVNPRSFGYGTSQRGDNILTPFFNVDGTLLYSLQRVSLSAGVSKQLLVNNPSFDQTYLTYTGDWSWQAGREFSGDLSASQQQSQTSFVDVRSSEVNKQTFRTWHGNADWRPRSDSRLGILFDDNFGENSTALLAPNDFHRVAGRAEAGFQSDLGHEIVIGASETRNRYPNRVIVPYAPIDNTYLQRQGDISTRFEVSALTSLDALIGYARRYYSQITSRDFSGPVGSVGITWQPTGQTTVRVAEGRNLDEVIDAFRIYSVSTATQGLITYEYSPLIQLTFGADLNRVDFRGIPQNLLTYLYGPGPRHVDQYLDAKLGVAWSPHDRLTVRLDEIASRRHSTLATYQYRDLSTQLTVQYRAGP